MTVARSTAMSRTGLAPGLDIAPEDLREFDRYVSELAVWDAANRAKDREDERLDAMRVHNGMTLDEFLAQLRTEPGK
jgi:hypothetical protein